MLFRSDNVADSSRRSAKTWCRSHPYVDRQAFVVDIFDVIEKETTEDIERMGGVFDSTTTEYLDMSIMAHIKSRLPWLFFLMLSYVITGNIIAGFEHSLSKVIQLVAYMPMLMGTGGNSGSQSATVVIRSLAVGDLDFKDIGRVLSKELRISLSIGLILSILNFLRVYFLERETVGIALTVCLAMIVIVVVAKTIGSMLPMIAKKVGIDPALMASPMIASLTDMVSVITYFLLAKVVLGI